MSATPPPASVIVKSSALKSSAVAPASTATPPSYISTTPPAAPESRPQKNFPVVELYKSVCPSELQSPKESCKKLPATYKLLVEAVPDIVTIPSVPIIIEDVPTTVSPSAL